MAIFYTDTGSITNLTVASINATGSLLGTASFATTAQNVLGSITSASFSSTASYLNPLNQNVQVTGSIDVTTKVTAGGIDTTFISYVGAVGGGIEVDASTIYDSLGSSSIQWDTRELKDTAGNLILDWQFGQFTGTSSLASTASYVKNAVTASYILGSGVSGNITGNAANITAYTINQNLGTTNQVTFAGVTASLNGTATTASYVTGSIHTSANPALSASYALTSSYVLNSVSSSFASTSSYVNTLRQNVIVSGSVDITNGGSLTTSGDITSGGVLKSLARGGDEGGEIFLTGSVTNTTIVNGVNIDVYQNKLRIFEAGGTNRGGYYDITALGTGVSTNLLSGGSGATLNGGTNVNNRIITATGTSPELNGEANLTFDGSTLAVTGNVTATSFTGSLQGTATTASYYPVNVIITAITTTGAGTYTPTAGMKACEVIVTGGGGGSNTAANTDTVTGGGGAAGTAIRTYTAAQIGASQPYFVGTGGIIGGNGTASSFGGSGTAAAISGSGGGVGGAQLAGATTVGVSPGGSGGTANGGIVNLTGQGGGMGVRIDTTTGYGGNGGASYWGGGPSQTTVDTAATAGTSPGSGASGAHASSATDRSGAAGADGIVYITEYF
jgi:hypothetical protein